MPLDEDRGLRWQIQLERDRCYAFSAVISESVEELKLFIVDPMGVGLFSTTAKQRVFKGFCIEGRVYSGSGWGVRQNRPRIRRLNLAQAVP